MPGRYYIGTCGWNYPAWQDNFYAGIAEQHWLEYYASRFNTVEINATFYRRQQRSTYEHWAAQVPGDFRFAIKGHRYITHNLKLSRAAAPLHDEHERAAGLGSKLAVVLWQLPRNLHKNLSRLSEFTGALQGWSEARHAMEFRHLSWFDEEVAVLLSQHRLAVCISDAADWPVWDRVTTDLVYVRLHGHNQTYVSSYSERALRIWAGRIRQWCNERRDVYVYFDNDADAAAPVNAQRLLEILREQEQ